MAAESDWVDDFVARVHREIERFAAARNLKQAVVEVELRDRSHFRLDSILPEPGSGFVTFVVHAAEGEPEEVMVQVQSITRIELHRADDPEPPFGFSAARAT